MNKRSALLLLVAAVFCLSNARSQTLPPAGCNQNNQCFSFTYKGYKVSLNGQTVTLSFSVKNNCAHDLSNVAFELPAGATATALPGSKYNYTTSITNNPFRAIKFEGVNISGYKNGASDNFSYTISKAVFDLLGTIRVRAKAGTSIGLVSFNKVCAETQCIVSDAQLSNITYSSSGVSGTNLDALTKQGKPVKVCFTVAASPGNKTYTFASYKAPYPVYVEAAAHQQVLFDYKTIVVGPAGGNFCLEIAVPDCYYQVDFVKGCVLVNLGPAGTNNFYGKQNRLLSHSEGGTSPCTPDETTGNEGCTPGYWKQTQHFGSWAPSVPTGTNATLFFDVFTVCDMDGTNCSYRGLPADLTLLQALQLGGGGFNALARHAAAAYLSASSNAVDYGITKVNVVTNVIQAFKTGSTAYHAVLEAANEKYCPLGRADITTSAAQAAGKETPVLENSQALSASPNPFTGRTTINFVLVHEGRYTVDLFDTQGKAVRNLRSGNGKAGQQQQATLESAGLNRGMYLVQLVNGAYTKTLKVVVQQ